MADADGVIGEPTLLSTIDSNFIPSAMPRAPHAGLEDAISGKFFLADEGRVLRYAVSPPDKDAFDARIVLRFGQMIEDGFVDEVALLRARGDLHLGLPSMRAVGYRQIWSHLDGEYGLAEALRRGLIATRHYAKRQMTWLRGDAGWNWIDAAEPAALAKVLNAVESRPV